MSPLRDSLSRFAFAPLAMARSFGWKSRFSRMLLLLGLLLGQIGLPNLAGGFSASRGCQNPNSAPGARCQCPPSLRRVGNCCCASKRAVNSQHCGRTCSPPASQTQRTCCQKKAAVESVARQPSSRNAIPEMRDDCPCGNGSDIAGYRCTDPRVLPRKIELSREPIILVTDQSVNDSACGELLPPPLPPPKPFLG
jgi:hypothetical protein